MHFAYRRYHRSMVSWLLFTTFVHPPHLLSSTIHSPSVIIQHVFPALLSSCNTYYLDCVREPVMAIYSTQWPDPCNSPFLHSQPQTTTSSIAILFMRLLSIAYLQCSFFVLIHRVIVPSSYYCFLSIHDFSVSLCTMAFDNGYPSAIV